MGEDGRLQEATEKDIAELQRYIASCLEGYASVWGAEAAALQLVDHITSEYCLFVRRKEPSQQEE